MQILAQKTRDIMIIIEDLLQLSASIRDNASTCAKLSFGFANMIQTIQKHSQMKTIWNNDVELEER